MFGWLRSRSTGLLRVRCTFETDRLGEVVLDSPPGVVEHPIVAVAAGEDNLEVVVPIVAAVDLPIAVVAVVGSLPIAAVAAEDPEGVPPIAAAVDPIAGVVGPIGLVAVVGIHVVGPEVVPIAVAEDTLAGDPIVAAVPIAAEVVPTVAAGHRSEAVRFDGLPYLKPCLLY